MTKSCLVCERAITVDDIAVQDATVWQSTGNYGSRVYDPVNAASFLEALICDDCLMRKKALIEEITVRLTETVTGRRQPDF